MRKRVEQEKWEKVENPIVQLDKSARDLIARIEANKKTDYTFLVELLLEILSCQMRFLASIYVSIYLEEDYIDSELDRNVLNFFIGECDTYNELLELCQRLQRFLNKPKRAKADRAFSEIDYAKKFGRNFFKINYSKLRMKAPPFSLEIDDKQSGYFKQYMEHMRILIDNFKSQTEFLHENIEVKWDPKPYYDDLVEFQRKAAKMLGLKNTKVRVAKYKSGRCRLTLNNQEKIQLAPVVIPLKRARLPRFASIFYFNPKETTEQCSAVYKELTGGGRFFYTKDEDLFNQLYFKKGNIVEKPFLPAEFRLWEKDLDLWLYEGDIFDLNFLEDIEGVKSAMVSILYQDTRLRTPLSRRLEILAGPEVVDELETKGNLERGKIYETSSGRLEGFDHILHCPIYDLGQNKKDIPDKKIEDEILKTTIKNIIRECENLEISWLIVPAMGSFWAGQTRNIVATKWCKEIRDMDNKNDLKRIIFSFTNSETLETYRNTIYRQIDDKFSGYHLPITRMHSDMTAAPNNEDRIDATTDLATYLYVFITACSLRSAYNAVNKNKNSIPEYFSSGNLKKTIDIFNARLTPGQTNPEHTRSLTIGKWHEISNHCQNVAKGKGLEWFFRICEGNINFAEIRNKTAHPSGRGYVTDESHKESADKATNSLRELIRNPEHSFFKQEEVMLIYVESISFDEPDLELDYWSLEGGFDIPRKRRLTDEIIDFENTHFHLHRVYLLEPKDNNRDNKIRSLLLHPFILFGTCNSCYRRSVFWLKDVKCRGNNVEMDYASVDCGCEQKNNDLIAGFKVKDLKEELEKILKELSRKLE